MRRLLCLIALAGLISGCSMAAMTKGMNSINRTLTTSFAPSIEMKQLDPWGHWVPCNGSWYDIHRHRAAVRFYPGADVRIVSIEPTFDGNGFGVGGDYIVWLPDRTDRKHELKIMLILKPTGGDPVEKPYTIQLDYHED